MVVGSGFRIGETTARKNIIKRAQPKQKRLRIQLLTGENLRKGGKIFLSRRIARNGGKEKYKKAPAGHQRQGLKEEIVVILR